MRKRRFTDEQVIGFIKQADAGMSVADLCRREGFSSATLYKWRAKFGGVEASDAKRLRELEAENNRLKKLLAESALEQAMEQALIARFGTLGRVPTPLLLRSHNGLVFTSRSFTVQVRSYGLRQEFIPLHSPEQNGLVERVIRTLKERCVHRHRFESLQHAIRVIGEWIHFYNHLRPHQALNMRPPLKRLH